MLIMGSSLLALSFGGGVMNSELDSVHRFYKENPTIKTEVVDNVIIHEPKDTQIMCLAKTIYMESRNESYLGQQKVAEVIMNRVKSIRYPNTICEVVKQKKKVGSRYIYQFSSWNPKDPNYVNAAIVFSNMGGKKVEVEAREKSVEIANIVLNGIPSISRNTLHFHSTAVNPAWADETKKVAEVGNHIFYAGVK